MVFDVSFGESIWQDAPSPDPGPGRKVKIKAVYEVPADQDAKKDGVWNGRVSSPEDEYTFYR